MRVLTIAITITVLHLAAQSSVWAHAGGSQEDRWAKEFCKASFCGIMSSSKWQLCCEGHGECCVYLQLEAGGGGASSRRVPSSSEQNTGSSYTHRVQPPPKGSHQLPKPERLSSRPQPPSIRPHPQPLRPSIRPHPPSIRPHPPSIRPHPPSSQPHRPSSHPHRPSIRPHPPSSQPHPPSSRPHPPSIRPHPPSSQPHRPSIRPHPPSSQPQPPSIRPHPPSSQPHRPSSHPQPPSSQPHRPSSRPHPPSSQPHPPASNPTPLLSHPEPPPGRLPSRPQFQWFQKGRKEPKKAVAKPRKVPAQDTALLLVAPEQSSDNEVYSSPAPKTKDRWGEEFCRASYCGIMPSVKWNHCCENFGQCCVYLLLARPKDLKSPFAFQEIATVTHPKRKFEYGFSHRPQPSPGSSKAQDNRPKTFLYSPQEQPVHTAPSTPKAAVKHVTTSSVVVKQPFRPQRQASYYNEVYAMEGDKWGREYCRTSYCSIMPSSKWAHCCDNYRKCCAYVYHTQGKDVKNPFAYEEISIFSIPLRPPRIRPIHRMSTKEVQADEPQTSTHGPPDADQLLPEGDQPPATGETPQGSPAPKPQPWTDHKPDNHTEGPQLSKERTQGLAPGPQTSKEQTPEDPQPAEDRRLRYDVDQGTAEVGTESSPIVVPLTSDSPVLDRALVTFNDVVAKEEAKRCRPRYCAILSPDQWRSCCSRYRQCCAYARYLEPRGPFYFEEDPTKIH